MASFNLGAINMALNEPAREADGVDFSDKKSKLNTVEDAKELVTAINNCPDLQFLRLTGNTVGVEAAGAIATALEGHPEFKMAWWSDMFTGRMKTEIPLALRALGDSMITAGARLSVLDLSDNAFGPIGVEGLAELLASSVCCQLQELRLNNNGLGITGGRMLAKALLGSNSGSPPRLKVFIAGRNRLENDGAIALADVFKKMGSLEHVAMPQNGIYHVGISALSTAFSSNPDLKILNLNDNTIGPKGAAAVAEMLPHLKNITDVNFGDCLLKSAGAMVLADAFEKNGIALERLDLSDNEMSGEACVRVAQAVGSAGGAQTVVLRGNRVGSATTRARLRDALGEDVVVLRDEDAGSDEESGDETDEESDEPDEEDDNEDAEDEPSEADTSTENAVDLEVVQKVISVVLDESGVEEVKTDVSRFLDEPTLENFRLLGDNAADLIDAHLQSIKQCSDLMCAYVEAVMKVSGLCGGSNADTQVAEQARVLYERLVACSRREHAAQWALANAMLVALGLLKSETKKTKIAWNLDGCYSVLSSVIAQPYFPVNLRETIRFFVKNRKSGHIGEADFTLGSYPNLV